MTITKLAGRVPITQTQLRRMAAVGRGVHLYLDTVPGVVLADVTDAIRPGVIVVRVAGGDPREIQETVDRHCPLGVLAAIEVRRATTRDRIVARFRWWCVRWWRFFSK